MLVAAKGLRVGDVVRHENYQAEVLDGSRPSKDIFGRDMMRFRARIIKGPDRIGEEGDLVYGPGGVAHVVTKDGGDGLEPFRITP